MVDWDRAVAFGRADGVVEIVGFFVGAVVVVGADNESAATPVHKTQVCGIGDSLLAVVLVFVLLGGAAAVCAVPLEFAVRSVVWSCRRPQKPVVGEEQGLVRGGWQLRIVLGVRRGLRHLPPEARAPGSALVDHGRTGCYESQCASFMPSDISLVWFDDSNTNVSVG